MALGLSKLQVVEQKLEIYEDLTKQMLSKLEAAVEKIAEANNQTNLLLERHENRLDEGERSHTLILKMLEEIKESHKDDVDKLHGRITTMQKRVDENQKFVVAAGAVLGTVVAVAQLLPMMGWTLTPVNSSGIVGETSIHHVVS